MNNDALSSALMQSRSMRIALPVQRGFIFASAGDIIRCEAKGNYSCVYLNGGKKLLLAKTLGQMETMLGGKPFLRVHNSYIINMDYLMSYVRGDGGYVVLTDGSEVTVSRERKPAFLQHIDYL